MTNKELKERLDSAETSSEKKGIIEFLNIESIKLDMHF